MKEFPFGNDVEIVCGLLDMTTEELAERLSVSRMTLNRWKNGESEMFFTAQNKYRGQIKFAEITD